MNMLEQLHFEEQIQNAGISVGNTEEERLDASLKYLRFQMKELYKNNGPEAAKHDLVSGLQDILKQRDAVVKKCDMLISTLIEIEEELNLKDATGKNVLQMVLLKSESLFDNQ